MLYTIGHRESYLSAIAESDSGKILKIGKCPDYGGGYAFVSIEDAQKRINEAYRGLGYVVFGLKTDLDNTEQSENGWWRVLSNDSEIVVLPESMEN